MPTLSSTPPNERDATAWRCPPLDVESPWETLRTLSLTRHSFNGWADKFLTTPDVGIDDLILGASEKRGRWVWKAIYHDFQAKNTSVDHGTEID